MLTDKQENFVRYLIKGMSQRQAYRKAYPNDNSSDEVVDKNASHLLNKNSKVLARYQELKEKADDKAILSSKERMIFLSDIIKGHVGEKYVIEDSSGKKIVCESPAELSSKLKALDLLNKMDHIYVTKIEGDLSVTKLEDLL